MAPDAAVHCAPELASALFRKVLGHFATGVAAVTGLDGDTPVGMALNSFTSVSLRPPLVSFCVAHTSATWPVLRRSGRVCVNVLAEHQRELSAQLAGSRGERFTGVAWRPSRYGLPLLTGAIAWLDCIVEAEHPAGDHDIVVARVLDLEAADDAGPLVFYRGGYGGFTEVL